MPEPPADESQVNILIPPSFCQYAAGACDQAFEGIASSDTLFLYPSEPEIIAHTIESTVKELRAASPDKSFSSWKDLGVSGQIIFCQICKALRFTRLVIADVTTLNFNLLFEIGYALGLGQPVVPIRDTSYDIDEKVFSELGLLDTFGYVDFENSQELANNLLQLGIPPPNPLRDFELNQEQPLFAIKSHVVTEGMVRLMSSLKKSGLRFRTFDLRETPRLSLYDLNREVRSSRGIVIHLLSPERALALSHNARCAFVAGLAMATGKHVLMLQEEGTETVKHPIDYRDVVRLYSNPARIPELLTPLVREIVSSLQQTRFIPIALPLRKLERIDLGDLAAENEIRALDYYFVPTAQYNEAKRGHGTLVVGRKGSGKTAIFYAVRKAYKPSKAHLVLDLKPEGHQFVKLRELVLSKLTPGLQQHVVTAFWTYLLLMELAHKIVHEEYNYSFRQPRLRAAFEKVYDSYGGTTQEEQGDFSERLLRLVNEITEKHSHMESIATTAQVTELVYGGRIGPLRDALAEYLGHKDSVWVLLDNLDKSWPVKGTKAEDIMLLRGLLEAARKMQRELERKAVDFHALAFIRNDIYEHLLAQTPDRGKDTPIILDWSDPEAFREIVRRRIIVSTEQDATFDNIWLSFFDSHVGGEESFSYIFNRTLRRPRDVLRFIRESVNVAVNRAHDKVLEVDIVEAEKTYSEDSLVDVSLELEDIDPSYSDVLYAFIGANHILSTSQAENLLETGAGITTDEMPRLIDLLLWFGFLGYNIHPDEERYSHQFQHNPKKMRAGLRKRVGYCIHPAFRKALGCPDS
jgi:hypothetical protein